MPLTVERAETSYADRISLLDTENAFKVGPQIQKVESSGRRVIRCNLGEPDFPLPRHIAEEVKRQIDLGMTHYCDPQGVIELREAIADDISTTRGLHVTPDRVVVFPGAKPPIGFSQEAYCNPGDEVIYPSPGFPIYESFTRYVGAKPVPLHLDEASGFNFQARDLEALITERTKLVFLNFPSNPTGGVATPQLLEDVAETILRHAPPHVRVYSDEVYEKIIFGGRAHYSIASVPEMEQRTIIVGGVSKSYCWTGGRIGWAVFPSNEEAAVFKNLNINYFSCVPAYNQLGAAYAIRSAESEVVVEQMVRAFETRRDAVVERLNAIPGVRCPMPSGAFYAFPNIAGVCDRLSVFDAYEALPFDVQARTSPASIFQQFLLFRYAVATMDRRSFGRIGAEGKHYLRLSIATSLEDLLEATRRIGAAAEDYAGFASFMRDFTV